MLAPRAAVAASLSLTILALAAACGNPPKGGGGDDTVDAMGTGGPPDACVGLECKKVNCTGMGIGTTRISGTVYAPNGTLPLYNASVYVPLQDPGPLTAGVTCNKCNDILPGNPTSQTTTDEFGHFNLDNVPVTDNLPVVIQLGKWRRQITIQSAVNACADNALDKSVTRLPKTKAEGDIPRIAITTGDADAMDCFVRKIGIADTEISTDKGDGRVNLFSGNGAKQFVTGWKGLKAGESVNFSDATTLWNDPAKLKTYDIVILSCEGAWPSDRDTTQDPPTDGDTNSGVAPADTNKVTPLSARKALYDYANLGGRIFMSHWHNMWLEYGPMEWPSIITFRSGYFLR